MAPWDPAAPGSTSQADNQTTPSAPAVFLVSAARTTTGNMGNTGLDCNGAEAVALELIITAVSGTTPSLTVSLMWSNDGTNWSDGDPADVFAAKTTTGRAFKNVTVKGRFCRLNWSISGTTPSFTFEVKALVLT